MDQQQYVEIWPGWETVRLIGRGSYGAVYEIRRQLGPVEESAAVKWLSIPQNPGDIKELRASGYDQTGLSRHFAAMKDKLVLEYSTMARLKGSTNVVYCDDIRTQCQKNGIGWDVYIKMELLTPLLDVLDNNMEERQILNLGQDIAQALASCHREKILHRDVKPQNIFVNREGRYKLGDFGVAKTMEGTGNASVRTGTYGYMAPEVFNGENYGPRADLYSLGLVLYWLLNERRLPFLPLPPQALTSEEESQARYRRFRGEPLPPPAHGSSGLKSIVMKACAYDPQDRYESAWNILRDLELLRMGRPVSAPPVSNVVGPGRDLDDGSATRGVFDSELYRRRTEDLRQGQSGRQLRQDTGSDRRSDVRWGQNSGSGQRQPGGDQQAYRQDQRQQTNRQDQRQQAAWQDQRQQTNRQDQRQQTNRQDQRQQAAWQDQRQQAAWQDQRQQSNRQDQRQQSNRQDQRQQSNRQDQRQQSNRQDQRQQANRQDQRQQAAWQDQRQQAAWQDQRQQSNRQDQRQQSNRQDQRQQSNRQSGKSFWGKPSDRKQGSSRQRQSGPDDQQWANYYQSASYDGNRNPYWGDDGPVDYSGGYGQQPRDYGQNQFWNGQSGNMNYDGPGADNYWGDNAGPGSYDGPWNGQDDYGAAFGNQNEGESWGDFGWPDDLDY